MLDGIERRSPETRARLPERHRVTQESRVERFGMVRLVSIGVDRSRRSCFSEPGLRQPLQSLQR